MDNLSSLWTTQPCERELDPVKIDSGPGSMDSPARLVQSIGAPWTTPRELWTPEDVGCAAYFLTTSMDTGNSTSECNFTDTLWVPTTLIGSTWIFLRSIEMWVWSSMA